MPSSASQARGASQARSKNIKRRKTDAAVKAVERATTSTLSGDAVVKALAELSEPRLFQLLHECNVNPYDFLRDTKGIGAQ